jgi:hypothetical protein
MPVHNIITTEGKAHALEAAAELVTAEEFGSV